MKNYDLFRFIDAQEMCFDSALAEIKNGRKTGHWIWYVFPQIYGLGHSFTAQKYSIKDMGEAKAYLECDILKNRLIKISSALLEINKPISSIVDPPDDLKIRSCMTLFRESSGGTIPVFDQVLDKFYGGKPDKLTLDILSKMKGFEKKPDRDTMRAVFKDTCEMIESSPVLKNLTDTSKSRQVLYMEEDVIDLPENPGFPACITVSSNRTFQEATELSAKYPGKRIAVLNFASATHPGGGVVNGARAQEESLCRCSNLYQCLTEKELIRDYYEFHRNRHNTLYTDALIYTPDVAIIKSDTNIPERLPESQWKKVDVITCAAPNLSAFRSQISVEELYHIHLCRGGKILSAAAANGVEVIVLGAFGCGAFGNDPKIVAGAYYDLLRQFGGYFRHISFAVFCANTESSNYTAFAETFK